MRSLIVSDSIFMPESYPSKLTIPVKGQEFEFTANNNQTVGEFQKMVLSNTENAINDFKLTLDDGKGDENLKIGELK